VNGEFERTWKLSWPIRQYVIETYPVRTGENREKEDIYWNPGEIFSVQSWSFKRNTATLDER
jgi:hypothetical protein